MKTNHVESSELSRAELTESRNPGKYLTLEPGDVHTLAMTPAAGKVRRTLENFMPGFFEFGDINQSYTRNSATFVPGHFAARPELKPYMHARRANIHPETHLTRVNIFGAPCLFGEYELMTLDAHRYRGSMREVLMRKGTVVDVLRRKNGLPYVPEIVGRLGKTMLETGRYFQEERGVKEVDYTVHLPRFEYYADAEWWYSQRRMSLRAVRRYRELVDERYEYIRGMFRSFFAFHGCTEPEYIEPLQKMVGDTKEGRIGLNRYGLASKPENLSDTFESDLASMGYTAAMRDVGRRDGLSVFVENENCLHYWERVKKSCAFSGLLIAPSQLYYADPKLDIQGDGDAAYRSTPMLLTEKVRAVDPWYAR